MRRVWRLVPQADEWSGQAAYGPCVAERGERERFLPSSWRAEDGKLVRWLGWIERARLIAAVATIAVLLLLFVVTLPFR